MAQYHITPKGEAKQCRASKKPCPLTNDHYPSRETAEEAYAASQKNIVSFKNLSVADEKAIDKLGERPYRLSHRAPVKDSEDFNKPLHHLDEIFPADVYAHPDWYGQEHQETLEQLITARNNPEALITIYRGVPLGVDEIHPGDWVSLSYNYARGESLTAGSEGTEGQVISFQVPAKVLYTDANSLEEWGFSGNISLKGVVRNA